MRRICRYLPLLVAVAVCLPFVQAQSGVDFGIGFGAAHAKSAGLVDFDQNGFIINCPSGSTTCQKTADLSNFMLGIGANLMLWKHAGIGGEAQFQPARKDYLTFQRVQSGGQSFSDVLQSRVTFYDFNGILQPVATKKASLQFQGGIGGVNVKFYEKVSSSSNILGNSNSTGFFGSSNHFQVHGGIGVQLYLTEHVFLRPQVDLRYVPNFTQYGSNFVPAGSVWLGYSLGDR